MVIDFPVSSFSGRGEYKHLLSTRPNVSSLKNNAKKSSVRFLSISSSHDREREQSEDFKSGLINRKSDYGFDLSIFVLCPARVIPLYLLE